MRSKRATRIVAIILALMIVLSIMFVAFDALTASAYVTQDEIDRLREEKQDYERRKQEIQSKINTIEFSKRTEMAKKTVLDDRIVLTGLEIDNLSATIAAYETMITEKEIEVDEAIVREDAQLHKYMERVRDMEENGVITYLEIVFDSASFADLLARLDFVNDIMQADERTYTDLIDAREETIAVKEDLSQTKREMEVEKVLIEEKRAELAVQVSEATELIKTIEASLETERELYMAEAAEAERIQTEINTKVEELIRQEAAAAAAAVNRVRGTGQLAWPVPSAGEITSQFGTRMHPIYNVLRQHWGVDIPADYGADITSSDSGTVIISEYSSSYGHYIVVDHGNGYTTLYAHLSSRLVEVGESVSIGQTIGYCGSTGASTGPHLHFEVSENGVKVNPENYL